MGSTIELSMGDRLCDNNINVEVSCTQSECLSSDCLQHGQTNLSSHCQVHCLSPLYIKPSDFEFPLSFQTKQSIATQAWTSQTVILSLTTPPPNTIFL